MCYKPRTIKNNSKHFDCDHDRARIVVPCGHCGECVNKKRVDYQIRAYYEWLEAKNKGGYSLFVTMTYNEKSLPRLFGHPCFNVKDIQDFHKRLRKAISKCFPGVVDAFSYICCCEYGGETHRPHYHEIINVHDPRINEFFMRALIRSTWATQEIYVKDDNNKRIKLQDGSYKTYTVPFKGFVKFGDHGGVINSTGAIEYVTKYVCKDENFREVFGEFFDSIKDYHDDNALYDAYKEFRPFRLTSNGFGLYALECNDDDLLLHGKVKYYNSDGEQISSLPLYLERKKFFNVIQKNGESPRYVLNAGGVLARGIRFDDMRQAFEDKVVDILHNRDYIQDINVWLDIKDENSRYSALIRDFDTPILLLSAFRAYIHDNVGDFVDYCILKRGFRLSLIDGLSLDDLAVLPYLHKDKPYTVDDYSPTQFQPSAKSYIYADYERAFDLLSALAYMFGFSRDRYFRAEARKRDNFKRLIV